MAFTLNLAHGTQTATGGEDTLDTESNGVFVLTLNVENMVDGDHLEIRVYEKVLTGDSERLLDADNLADKQGDAATSSAQGSVIWQSRAIVAAFSVVFTIKQTAGTNHDYKWRVDQLA